MAVTASEKATRRVTKRVLRGVSRETSARGISEEATSAEEIFEITPRDGILA